MTPVETTCRFCQTPFTRSAKGRPSVFCGVACRRAAEFSLRLVKARIVRFEREAEHIRRFFGDEPRELGMRQRLDVVQREKASAESELLDLLRGFAGEDRAA